VNPDEGQHGHDDDDEADKVDNIVHEGAPLNEAGAFDATM
jgi:hypothetical protein